ncbi:aminopeptidase [Formosa agariphila KMM 3901]|uniref:Aminopeptidase N n=1 Tax=Formosa agariphila (strain DSM 15362 / KCTC 12365 / LMG 23005 / KMM 3901 / M-2Alg 35-1) TaxID=1347342 RepID=T2KLH6_FORAG|nr:M1 family metallopeptidase [Formosa agariphila]CDF78829.1 aminopeptidase [Formosa agariphila KMM 3901]
MKHFLYLLIGIFSSVLWSQQIDVIDFKSITAQVSIQPLEREISGKVSYVFDVLHATDSIFIDAQQMHISKVTLNKQDIAFTNDGKKLWILSDFERSDNNTLKLEYTATPKKAMYFVGWEYDGRQQVWTQGQGKYTSNWLPSFDDMNEKTTLDLTVNFLDGYEVIANGELIEKVKLEDDLTSWRYVSTKPMSNYLFAIAIGKYDKKILESKSGIPLELYYYPEDVSKVEPTYRYSAQLFNFLETEIGVPYPWDNYKQIPVADFLYAGMENTTATIFSDAFVVDDIGFVDRNYVNVNAHELAHQWFGDLVTETSGTHHWLQEGFATYYALLAERDIFGNDYYKMRLYEYAKELEAQDASGQSTALLNAKSSSTTFYKKGAWLLHALRVKVGDKAFKMAVRQYLEAHQFNNVETDDFIKAVEATSGENLDAFFDLWLNTVEFPKESIVENAKDDMSFYIKHLEHIECSVDKDVDFLMDASKFYYEKQEIIKKYPELITESVLLENGVEVRQTIAQTLRTIPSELQSAYETLLSDKSYQTQEMALYNLWSNFPDKRATYLEETKGRVGFKSKNIRQLWLVLALSTPEFEADKNASYINELISYTGPEYDFEVRELAFSYVDALQLYNEDSIINIKQATTHHNWRLSKMAKQLLSALETQPKYKAILSQLETQSTTP